MIRGSIEVARRTQVSGWIYAETGTVRDRLILAFAGDRCVGAGKVDRFRKDLLEAKLGDGYCGFDFPIKLNDDEALGAVIIKLQNSDVALIQRDTKLIGPADAAPASEHELGAISPARVAWMQDRGWLDQHEYDFLRAVQVGGAYERGLRQARRANAEVPPALRPEHVAHELLSLYAMGDVDIHRRKITTLAELAGPAQPQARPNDAQPQGRPKDAPPQARPHELPVIALWSGEACRLAIEERSHTKPRAGAPTVLATAPASAVEYGFGPDRVLFLHRHVSVAPLGIAPADGLVVFTATARPAAKAVPSLRNDKAA
jgi:hypothetical protein